MNQEGSGWKRIEVEGRVLSGRPGGAGTDVRRWGKVLDGS